tara:strand:+ start:564 stop:806 length:243 start_codon:yes stop_codon:yes gene_type:complete
VLVVVSLSDWDGHRVIGVFESEEIARQAVQEAKSSIARGSLSFDIVSKNQISLFQHIVYDDENRDDSYNVTVRKHIYEEA